MARSENGGRVNMSSCVKNSMQPKAQQAQWNVQVVRGKVTTRCLWNACKALSIGLLLLAIGTTMAVIGYYADQLSIRSEMRGNSTVKIRNESRGFHLNNLSYAGPIVMGVGGFIVVAACVMTFEARDSAAKIVPARFKANLNASLTGESTKTTPRAPRLFQRMESKRNTSVQTPGGGGKYYGLDKVKSSATGSEWSPKDDAATRKAFVATFVQFSRELMEKSPSERNRRCRQRMNEVKLNKSPSAPDLIGDVSGLASLDKESRAAGKGSSRAANSRHRESVRPPETASSNLLLRHNYLQRQALSVDNPSYDSCSWCTPPSVRLSRQHSKRSAGSRDSFDMDLGSSAGVAGSQTSMALDLHECQVTLKVKDESVTKRSDTARRHQLLRQKPVEDDSHSGLPKCSCFGKISLAPTVGKCSTGTKFSTSSKSPCHCCRRPATSACERSHTSKITADFRSRSFSQTCSYCDFIKSPFHEGSPKVFCIDDHRKTNHSSENVRFCCDEKFRCMSRNSPSMSPLRSPRQQRLEGSKCLLHRAKDPRNNPGKKRSTHRLEGSLSAEEQYTARTRIAAHPRSGSFSPPGHTVPPLSDENAPNAQEFLRN